MKIRRIALVNLFLIAALTITSAQVKLSFSPVKGKKYEYHTVTTQKQSVMGQEMEMEMGAKYLMEIENASSNEARVRFTYKEVTYLFLSAFMKMSYDSKYPAENPSEMDKILGQMFGSLVGQSVVLLVAPDGSVKSIEGLDAMVESMTAAIPDDQMAVALTAGIKQQFNEDAFKGTFEQSLKIFPEKAVKQGDSWTVENANDVGGMNTTTNAKYTLKEYKNNLATLNVSSNVEMLMSVGAEAKLSGTQTGTVVLDAKTGITLSSDVSQEVTGNISAQGFDASIELSTTVKVTTKEVK